jgi:hypothetical protein
MGLDDARRHELRLHAASRPAFPVLLALGRFARPIRRVPGLGWLVGDPVTMHRILNDADHFTTIGEGIVGHLWAQVLGDWVYEMLDGAGHHALRKKARDLFSEDTGRRRWCPGRPGRGCGGAPPSSSPAVPSTSPTWPGWLAAGSSLICSV